MKDREKNISKLSPGQQLQFFLRQLYPTDSQEKTTFANSIDDALQANGEVAELIYNSTINYMLRRLINTASFIKRKCDRNNQPEEKFIVELRKFIQENLNLSNNQEIEKLHTLLRECLNVRKKEITPTRKKSIRKIAQTNNEKCYICGCELDYENEQKYNFAEVEHIWPQSMGGLSEGENLQICCLKCNKAKKNYVDSSDFHYEEISLVSDEAQQYFSTEMERRYELALWSKNQFKCLICKKPASYVGKLRFKRRNLEDSWHFINIDTYCDLHYSIKKKQ